jgi:hypothetical protein
MNTFVPIFLYLSRRRTESKYLCVGRQYQFPDPYQHSDTTQLLQLIDRCEYNRYSFIVKLYLHVSSIVTWKFLYFVRAKQLRVSLIFIVNRDRLAGDFFYQEDACEAEFDIRAWKD